MNIAVFGWYHHQNAGDDRIQQCITRLFDGDTLAFLPAGRRIDRSFLRSYDAIIIGGGGIIMRHGGVFTDLARMKLDIPVGMLGVSVENLTDEGRRELRAILERCSFAWVRDVDSAIDLGSHPRVMVAPDVTWLYPFSARPTQGESVAVGLRSEQSFPEKDWVTAIRALVVQVRCWPLYFERGGDAEQLRRLFPEHPCPDEFTMEPLAKSSTVLTGRFHGIQFALQAKRPFIGISSKPKVLRFMKDHDLEALHLREGAAAQLGERYTELVNRREEIEAGIEALSMRLHGESIAAAQHVKDLLNSEVGSRLASPTSMFRRLASHLR